jgi:LysR substrate binding domain
MQFTFPNYSFGKAGQCDRQRGHYLELNQLRRALEQAQAALSFRDTFCPLAETRMFRIGIASDIGATLMPDILTRVRRETPGIRLQSKIRGNVDLLAALDDGSIDVGVSYIDKTALGTKQKNFIGNTISVVTTQSYFLSGSIARLTSKPLMPCSPKPRVYWVVSKTFFKALESS